MVNLLSSYNHYYTYICLCVNVRLTFVLCVIFVLIQFLILTSLLYFRHGCGKFSMKGIEICVEYFANRGHNEIVVFIPRHQQGSCGFKKLREKAYICFTPSRKVQGVRMTCYDDR